MQLPDQLLQSLQHVTSFDKEAFLKVHASGEQITSIRINPLKQIENRNAKIESKNPSSISDFPVPWSKYGYYLPERPSFTFDPLFHAGCYYVQEASSMFLEQALMQTVDLNRPLKVLDLSAAPGGKSTHILSVISPESLLVSNEVIKSRANILKDNIIKWGYSNAIVSSNDPKDFARLKGYFDVIVVDAPCSGSGLFRRDPEAIEEWSSQNVSLCNQRQQRILADVWPALKEEGILIYSTCSYSQEEDEDIVNWINKELNAEICPLTISHGIIESGGGYRFWPDKVKGEGFFISCFRKTTEEKQVAGKIKNSPTGITKNEAAILSPWIGKQPLEFIRHENTVYGWPSMLKNDFILLLNNLRILYSGTIIGELLRDKLVPHHSLAMSKIISEDIPKSILDYPRAILYLQRKDISLKTTVKGWQAATYEEQILGWMNVLPNRINNYYPKELRILKDNPD